MTKRTAISLPDELFRDIERARKRARQDRSTWIQEAASDYLKRRSKEEEIEAYFAGYERVPLTAEELALLQWNADRLRERLAEEPDPPAALDPED